MRYPVGTSKEEYYQKWYIASGFNERRSPTYLHEGIDLNLKTGGETDYGQPIYAISDYTLRYYHLAKHVNQNAYGVHFVYEINTPFGPRWVQCMHVQENPPIIAHPTGSEGDIIAYLGKTGTTVSHLHLSIYKVDPASFGGIDVVVGDEPTLNLWWENPTTLLTKLDTGVTMDCLIPNTPEWQAKYQDIIGKATKYDEFKSAGYETPQVIANIIDDFKQQNDTYKREVESANTEAEARRTDYNVLIKSLAEILDTRQEAPEIINKAQLDASQAGIVEDTQAQHKADLEAWALKEMEFKSEVAKWKAIAEQTADLGDYETSALIKEIIKRFTKALDLTRKV